MNIAQAIEHVTHSLTSCSDSARLDAELLVSLVCHKTRVQLYMDMAVELSHEQLTLLAVLSAKRLSNIPMAYILGEQEFWSLAFKVTCDTLIPRADTECLVAWILNHFSADHALSLADLGTGSGAIAIALGHECPAWQIDATDLSMEALQIARGNACSHSVANVSFYHGSWCEPLTHAPYDVIVANPPYIAEDDLHLAALDAEPAMALTAKQDGLAALILIASQAPAYLKSSGCLVMEHGYQQSEAVCQMMRAGGFDQVEAHQDTAGQDRFVTGLLSK